MSVRDPAWRSALPDAQEENDDPQNDGRQSPPLLVPKPRRPARAQKHSSASSIHSSLNQIVHEAARLEGERINAISRQSHRKQLEQDEIDRVFGVGAERILERPRTPWRLDPDHVVARPKSTPLTRPSNNVAKPQHTSQLGRVSDDNGAADDGPVSGTPLAEQSKRGGEIARPQTTAPYPSRSRHPTFHPHSRDRTHTLASGLKIDLPADLEHYLQAMRVEANEGTGDDASILQLARRRMGTPLSLGKARKGEDTASGVGVFDATPDNDDEDDGDDKVDDDKEGPDNGTDAESTSSQDEHVAPMNDSEKLEAIVEEFGPATQSNDVHKEERVVASEVSILVRRVIVRGYLVLTTHRTCFLALLTYNPPSSEALWQGPAMIHRPGIARRRRKAWIILTRESLTAYRSSTELYEPLGGVKLTDICGVQPDLMRNSVNFNIKGKKSSLQFETKEAAMGWQREIDAAIWRNTHDFEKIRICIPHVRVAQATLSEYLDFSTIIRLDILDIDRPTYKHPNWHRHERDPMGTKDVSFAVLKSSTQVAPRIQTILSSFAQQRDEHGIANWWKLPTTVLDIDGPRNSAAVAAVEEDSKHGSKSRRQRNMVEEFALECRPEEVSVFKAHLSGTLALGGTIAVSPHYLAFLCQHKVSGFPDTRVRIPLRDVTGAEPCKAFLWHLYGARITIRAHHDLIFELLEEEQRDRVVELIREAKNRSSTASPQTPSQSGQENSHTDVQKSASSKLAMQGKNSSAVLPPSYINYVPRAINLGPKRRLRVAPMRIHCLTIGSRGDVQPYVALCKQLRKDGHTVTIVSHDEYRDWVEGHGIAFRPVGGDPGELMKLSVDNNFFSPQFYREAMSKFRHWLDELLRGIMEQCWDADLIIESPSTFGGIHVAEAIDCYYMRAFTMPWTRTTKYPQAFSVPGVDLGPQYNVMTYNVFDQILWLSSSGQINRWRKHMLHLRPTDLAKLHQSSVPFMYNFSPAVVPPPLDWGDRIKVTGYWNLPTSPSSWTPPNALSKFMEKARADNKKVCYIGFGSITMSDPRGAQRAMYKAVRQSDVRAVISLGWSARMAKDKGDEGDEETEKLEVPKEAYVVESIPHDWLFPKIDFAVHHGGAGTTGASLHNGLVTLIHPFFGDQFFWSQRVAKLGAGVRVKSLSAEDLTDALIRVRDDRVMREKAQQVGEQIRKERGVEAAVDFIYHNLTRAKRTQHRLPARSLQQPKRSRSCQRRKPSVMPATDDLSKEDEVLPSSPRSASSPVDDTDRMEHIQTANDNMPRSRSHNPFRGSTIRSAASSPAKLLRKMSRHPRAHDQRATREPHNAAKNAEEREPSTEGDINGMLHDSPEEEPSVSEDADEEEGLPGDESQPSVPTPVKRLSWYSQNLHLPSLTLPQMSMPHMHFLDLRLLGHGHFGFGGGQSETGGAKDDMTEKQILEVEHEEQMAHLSARDEDKRRRILLEEEWRKQGRYDLVHDSPHTSPATGAAQGSEEAKQPDADAHASPKQAEPGAVDAAP